MAEQLQDFDFSVSNSRRTKYPWDQWLNGRPWRCVQGEDFKCNVKTMMHVVRNAARRNGMEANVKKVSDDTIVFQAYTP